MADPLIESISRKKLIFTVTPGRSGTDYLAKLLQTVPGVSAHHEPAPDFVLAMRFMQLDRKVAYGFLRDQKLKAIAEVTEPVYAETSHLFGKGFFEPMLLMGIRPCLIILRRPPAEVALSYLARKTVPVHTERGQSYLLDPRFRDVLTLPGWENLSDYQLCFWYALEMERRQWRYSQMAQLLELPIFDVTNLELNDPGKFEAMLDAFQLEKTQQVFAQHRIISAERHNASPEAPVVLPNAAEQEAEVWERIAIYEPLLHALVNKRYQLPPRAANDGLIRHA